MNADDDDVTLALQGAYGDLVRAVELTRRRTADRIDTTALVSELHELRILMSAAAQLMKSFDLGRYGGVLKWPPGAEPPGPDGPTPASHVDAADRDLLEAYEHLERAAASLTPARRRMADLR